MSCSGSESKVSDLGAPGKHLDQVIVQVVVELALKIPFKSPGFEFARSQVEPVGVIVNALILEAYGDLDSPVHRAGAPLKHRVLVAVQLSPDL